MEIGPGSTGISPTILIGSGRPVATYLGVRALPCRSTGSEGSCDRRGREARGAIPMCFI